MPPRHSVEAIFTIHPAKMTRQSAFDTPSPSRFETSRATLWIDGIMNRVIVAGGVSVVVAVLGIFAFIFWQVLPLFGNAEVKKTGSIPLESRDYRILGADDYGELPFLVDDTGGIFFVDVVGKRGVRPVTPEFAETPETPQKLTAAEYSARRQEVVFGTAEGLFSIVKIEYATGVEDGRRVLDGSAKASAYLPLGDSRAPITRIAYGDSGEDKMLAALQMADGKSRLIAARLTQERSLLGAGEIQIGKTFDLTAQVAGEPVALLVASSADSVVVCTREGELFHFHLRDENVELRQRIRPFADAAEPAIASAHYLLGDVTLVLTNPAGQNRLLSLCVGPGETERGFHPIHQLAELGGGATFFAPSLRNKAYLTGVGNTVSLRYATTEAVRWEGVQPRGMRLGALSGRYDRILLMSDQPSLEVFSLKDPHPEVSLRALFGKIWYEGAPAPGYVWQSTGGSDEFEPKLSLVPLILGTLKGTFYGTLLGVPIALMAALYTSQFAVARFRAFIKPVMEIMASLPSVVLGFFAALWLAPLGETRVPSLLLMALGIPAAALLQGWLWQTLPVPWRARLKPGTEFIAFMPVMLLAGWVAWSLGPLLEQLCFTVQDPSTGARVADFRQWWPQAIGLEFQQRNSLVVGFVMGFAVIPIVFTVTEDSLSGVPASLRTGSLALGATRWQTALRVVVPTASAGIFSALMIALGRAVGETMIVVMATGNTPILSMNLFSGMRTLSANLAVELSEAPHHGTLYRTLFLGALVLFILTFTVNTVAELLRHRLRERFKLN